MYVYREIYICIYRDVYIDIYIYTGITEGLYSLLPYLP